MAEVRPRIMQLIAHPATPAPAVRQVEAAAERADHGRLLFLDYYLSAELAALAVPLREFPARGDRLWQHTCFEVFVKASGSKSYLELNFSPSGAWAAYLFDDYRQGMRPAPATGPQRFAITRDTQHLNLQLAFDLAPYGELSSAAVLEVGLAAVIEDAGHALSCWALAHGAGTADFHRAENWTLRLALQDTGGSPA